MEAIQTIRKMYVNTAKINAFFKLLPCTIVGREMNKRLFAFSNIITKFKEEITMEKQCKHKSEFYTCKRMRLLEYLLNRGFTPELTLPDVNNPKYKIWKFRNTPELEEVLDEYFGK